MPVKRMPQKKTTKKPEPELKSQLDTLIPIVGIGASAGGLEAFEQFFRVIPVNSGIAFIIISHLDPHHTSMLADILGRVTKMPVLEAQDAMEVLANHVYTIPPNREMTIFHRKIQLTVPDNSLGDRMKIDLFFRSLAEELGARAIGIVFSGTGTDGTLGLRAISGSGGISFVQDPVTAKYDGMPKSAINSGCATFILPVEQMPEQVIASVKNLFGDMSTDPLTPRVTFDSDKTGAISRILRIIRSKTGHDFLQYKKSTIHRRISRRMAVHAIQDPATYARYLEEHPGEVKTLFRELLINVTSFFRDPEAFEVLKKDVLPDLIRNKDEFEPFRVWVPACATGEEAYSLAIIIRELFDELGLDEKVQIYSTDIVEDVIAVARRGFYPPNIVSDVSSDRLKKFFVREENGFQVNKSIREMVVFATQNVIKDPPFTKLDLLSCRNLLIYLETDLQSSLIPIFHYSLKPKGILFLSPAESIGVFPDLFRQINQKWKIYEASGNKSNLNEIMKTPISWSNTSPAVETPDFTHQHADTQMVELMRRALLQVYAPPSVVTDDAGNLLYVHGDTGKFLRPAPGQASFSVNEMAREGLQPDLKTAIFTASTQKKTVACKNLQVKTNGGFEKVDLEVRPIISSDSIQGGLIISFLMPDSHILHEIGDKNRKIRRSEAKPGRIEDLQQELQYTKENLHATVEEMQAANEELKSTNEELQSTNEELQSTNEELETSKEELQSTNEELETSKEELQSLNEEVMTVNSELQAKILQYTDVQNDMKNLLSSTGIGTIFLDIDLVIRRFTPEAAKIYKLIVSDVGRPLSDIKSMIVQDDLLENARIVLDSLIPQEKEIQTIEKLSYLVRILPYRTLDNVIDGVVLTFTDYSYRKTAEDEVIQAREYAESIVNTVREPLLVLDRNLTVISANQSFYRTFEVSPEETSGKNLKELSERQWDISSLMILLNTIISEGTSFEDKPVTIDLSENRIKKFILNARGLQRKSGEAELILLAMEEITGKNILT
ncbi:MAG: chemotaxis protein CheB [Methanobacteriota archaeon]